jgi:alpha-L-fucosidase
MEAQTTVGHKRLLRWQTPVTSDRVRVRITGARLEPTLAEIGLFKQAAIVPPPVIAERTGAGMVALSSPKGLKIVYTIDGSMPTPQSAVYSVPISLERGGTINAACVAEDGRLGMLVSKRFPGFIPTGWKLVGDGQGGVAIDGNPATVWQAKTAALPTSLTVDMGRALRIGGFSYLPSSDAIGAIDSYRFETSLDGRNWTTTVAEDRFGNIGNDPSLQEVTFAAVTARYFRLTALKLAKGTVARIAEISVLPIEAGQ